MFSSWRRKRIGGISIGAGRRWCICNHIGIWYWKCFGIINGGKGGAGNNIFLQFFGIIDFF